MQTRDTNTKTAHSNEIVFRQFEFRKAENASASRTFEVVASSDAVDSYGTRVVANWNLTRFEKNPIVLFGHNSRDAECIIGTASNVRVDNNALKADITLLDAETSPMAERCMKLLSAGALRGVSVGFMPHSYRWARENDVEVLELDDNELFEISLTSIPANPDALAQLCARARQERSAGEATPAPPATQTEPAADPMPAPSAPAPVENDALVAAVRKVTGKDGDEAAGALIALAERAAKCEALESEVRELKRTMLLNDAVVAGKITRDFANSPECKAMSDAELRGYLAAKQVRGVHLNAPAQPTKANRSTELTPEEVSSAKAHGISLDAMKASKIQLLSSNTTPEE